MIRKIDRLFARLILGAGALFFGATAWADDEDVLVVGEHAPGRMPEGEAPFLLDSVLTGNPFLSAHFLQLWAQAVQSVWDDFKGLNLDDDSWGLLLNGFEGQFTGIFKQLLDAVVHLNEEDAVDGAHLHPEAITACLLKYLTYLTRDLPEPLRNGLLTARAYIARPDPPSFNTYAARVAHFNANPNERVVHRHPFFVFMHDGYWNMRGWANQYPVLREQRHGLFHLAHEGVNLAWINENIYYAAGMAQAQYQEYLAAVLRTLHKLLFYSKPRGDFDQDVVSRFMVYLAPVFRNVVEEAREAEADEDSRREVPLRIQAAVLAKFLAELNSLMLRHLGGDAAYAVVEVMDQWERDVEVQVTRLRAMFLGNDGLDDVVGHFDSMNLADYFGRDDDGSDREALPRLDTSPERERAPLCRVQRTYAHVDVDDVEVEIIAGFDDLVDDENSDDDPSGEIIRLGAVAEQGGLLPDADIPDLVAPNPQRAQGILPIVEFDALIGGGVVFNGCG